MNFTFELSKIFGVLPFEVMKQDKDEVIMLINYMNEKNENNIEEPTSGVVSERDADNSFWAAL